MSDLSSVAENDVRAKEDVRHARTTGNIRVAEIRMREGDTEEFLIAGDVIAEIIAFVTEHDEGRGTKHFITPILLHIASITTILHHELLHHFYTLPPSRP